jgi:hypothetical protein
MLSKRLERGSTVDQLGTFKEHSEVISSETKVNASTG